MRIMPRLNLPPTCTRMLRHREHVVPAAFQGNRPIQFQPCEPGCLHGDVFHFILYEQPEPVAGPVLRGRGCERDLDGIQWVVNGIKQLAEAMLTRSSALFMQ